MKNFLISLCLIFLLPLTTNAEFIGEVFCLDNGSNDLLITPINNTDRARVLPERTSRTYMGTIRAKKWSSHCSHCQC